MQLKILDSTFSVVKLSSAGPIPLWAASGRPFSVTRTNDELSIVVPSESVPAHEGFGNIENDFKCVKVEASVLDFSLTGILASLAAPLAEAKISIFVNATCNTGYLFIKSHSIDKARAVLEQAGHTFIH
jgi:Uncharacterized conserved protein